MSKKDDRVDGLMKYESGEPMTFAPGESELYREGWERIFVPCLRTGDEHYCAEPETSDGVTCSRCGRVPR